jgi:hypothetical protein
MTDIELLVQEDVEKMRRIAIMKTINSEEFDNKFDNGEDIIKYLDFSKAEKIDNFNSSQNISIEFPKNIISHLEKEAKKIGISTESIIKVWIAERLKKELKVQL